MALLYAFLQSQHLPFQTLEINPAGEPWDEVRYRLERKFGMHDLTAKRKPDSFLVGWVAVPKQTFAAYQRTPPLAADHWCQNGQRLILARRPFAPGQRAHVPPRFQQQEQALARILSEPLSTLPPARPATAAPSALRITADMTEDEKMHVLMEHTHQQTAPATHATRPASRPPSGYICFRCQTPGHWKQDCTMPRQLCRPPRHEYKTPAGIPRSFLRPAESEEDRRHAMKTLDGRFVVEQTPTGLAPLPAYLTDELIADAPSSPDDFDDACDDPEHV